MAAVQLLFDQLSDLGDPLPAGVPNDETGFCALVKRASAAAALGTNGNGGGDPLLGTLARALIRRVWAAEAAMEEEGKEEVSGLGLLWVAGCLNEGALSPGCAPVSTPEPFSSTRSTIPTYDLRQRRCMTLQSILTFLASRGYPYPLDGSGKAVDVLSFLAAELQVGVEGEKAVAAACRPVRVSLAARISLTTSLPVPTLKSPQASRMLAAKGLTPAAAGLAAGSGAPLLQPHETAAAATDDNGGDDDNNNPNEPVFAARLLVKSLRALEAPEGEGSAAASAGPEALLAAVERAVERRVGELPPGYTAEVGEELIPGNAIVRGVGLPA